jgi:oligopeptide transport system permease protein
VFRFFLKRLLQTLACLVLLLSFTFFLLRLLPGGPFDMEVPLSPEVKASLEARYHLDKPIYRQYIEYIKTLASGNLGSSYRFVDQDVQDLIGEALPVTLKLGFFALVISFVLGIPLGLLAARNHNRYGDYIAMFLSTIGVSMPSFLLAPILILIFSFWLDLLPPALWESPKYYILPAFTLGLRPAATIARLVRSAALDVRNSDFVRTVRSKGGSENRILFKHVLKNCLIPIFGISGPLIANILSGGFVVEILFAVPGLGHYFIESVLDRDFPMVISLTVLYGALLMGANLLMDMASILVDRRLEQVS